MKPGDRIEVYGSDGAQTPKLGYYVGDVPVFFIAKADGSLASLADASQRPDESMLEPGDEIIEAPDNPKLQMDDGSVRFGCQVWWGPAKESKKEAISGG